MPTAGATKSKLLDKLREVQRGKIQPIGFSRVADAQKAVNFLLLAELPAASDALVKAAVDAGADAIVLAIDGDGKDLVGATREKIVAAAEFAGTVPVGLSFSSDSTLSIDALESLADTKLDFIAASPQQSPTRLMRLTKIGRVMRVRANTSASLLRALGDLSIDIIAAAPPRARRGADTLTLYDLMQYRQTIEFGRHPALLVAEQTIDVSSLQDLRDIGVLGLILPASLLGDSAQTVAAVIGEYRQAADKVERPKPTQFGDAPMLPRSAAPRPFGGDEPEIEPDDEPDDDE
ncbi:MAG TPA: hypothetical protein VMP10_01280 [Chloroflexota bacterium]|nr:hypothetical protein [Chloroflexota bacterium]